MTAAAKTTRAPRQITWDWEAAAYGLIKREMERREVTYKMLAAALEQYGIWESADQLNRKVNRKRFPASLLLAVLTALKVEVVELGGLRELHRRRRKPTEAAIREKARQLKKALKA